MRVLPTPVLRHATASTFVFHRFVDQWRLGLITHPRLGRHMIVGGHVERDETPAEAAVREAREESGLSVRLLGCPTPALPAGYPHQLVAAPWWITEVLVPADPHLDTPHVHLDHLYLALADTPTPLTEPAHPFGWFAEDDLDGLSMFADTRLLAHMLFPTIDSFAPVGARGSETDPMPLVSSLRARRDMHTERPEDHVDR